MPGFRKERKREICEERRMDGLHTVGGRENQKEALGTGVDLGAWGGVRPAIGSEWTLKINVCFVVFPETDPNGKIICVWNEIDWNFNLTWNLH